MSVTIAGVLEHIGWTNVELRALLELAYQISDAERRYRLVGGPESVLAARFDINATVPKDASARDVYPMLQALLADRFRLRLHTESRPLPVYLVTVAKDGRLGPNLKPTSIDCATFFADWARDRTIKGPVARDGTPMCLRSDDPFPRGNHIMSASTIAGLLSRAQGAADRPLINGTGLTGNFEWELRFAWSGAQNADAPWIGAAMEEQLGLKLEPRTWPVDVWVIDSVEMPTAD